MAQNFVLGRQVKIRFGILSNEDLAKTVVTAPEDHTITCGASITTQGSTTITVTSLTKPVAPGTAVLLGTSTAITITEPAAKGATVLTLNVPTAGIAKGTILYFDYGRIQCTTTAEAVDADTTVQVTPLPAALPDNAAGIFYATAPVKVYTTGHAATGATSISVRATSAAIPADATGYYAGIVTLKGGTSSGFSISNDDTESIVYGDDLAYSDGLVTNAAAEASYEFNILPTDDGYTRLEYAGQNAIGGIKGWVEIEQPAPSGLTTGNIVKGVVQLGEFSTDLPADGIVTGSTTFRFRGSPTIVPAA